MRGACWESEIAAGKKAAGKLPAYSTRGADNTAMCLKAMSLQRVILQKACNISYSRQLTTLNPGTRRNSSTFAVTTA